MGKLAAGSLNRRITIQMRKVGKDTWGQVHNDWQIVVTDLPANISTQTGLGAVGSEFVSGGGEQSRATASIRIRYRTDITSDMRVVYQEKTYDIHNVLPDEDGREYCDLVVSQGAVRV